MSSRVNYFHRQRVTEEELDLGFDLLEQADRALVADLGFVGIVSGAVVSPHAPAPDLTVDVSGPGVAYDALGRRIVIPSTQNVSVAIDENGVSTDVVSAGNERLVTVFLAFDRHEYDPRIDGLSQTVMFRRDESFRLLVAQGAEAPVGTAVPPAPRPDAVILADVRRTLGQAQIDSADISTARRQDGVVAGAEPRAIRRGRLIEALRDLLAFYDAHARGEADLHGASDIPAAASPAWADGAANPAGTVQERIDRVVSDLAAESGSQKIGAAAVSAVPQGLIAGTVRTQIQQLLGLLNMHLSQSGAHAASAIAYGGGPPWPDGATNPATTVEGQLDKLVTDLGAAAGGARVGAAAVVGAPDSLAAGSVAAQLAALLVLVNARARRAGDTFTGGLVPDATGLPLGAAGARWDAYLRRASIAGGAAGEPALEVAAPDQATPALVARGQLFAPSVVVDARHEATIPGSGTQTIWDYVRAGAFLPQIANDLADATTINAVTARNIAKAWGAVSAAGVLASPHWNVSSVARLAAGRYLVVLDVDPGTTNAVGATVVSNNLGSSFSVHISSPDGFAFEVRISSGGALSDQAFTFWVFGG
jgi:hypothetical protein